MISAKPMIQNKLISFINEYFVKDSGLIITNDTSFLEEGILDSTGIMELVAFIESDFKIRIEDDEIIPDNFESINKLVDFISGKLTENNV